MDDETQMAQFESQLEELVGEAREAGLDDQAVADVLSEVARKLREGLWRTRPAI